MDVTVNIGPKFLSVSPLLPVEIINDLKKRTEYKVHNYQFTSAHKLYGWDGTKRLFGVRDQKCPSGCYKRIKAVLEKNNCVVNLNFLNNYPAGGKPFVFDLELCDFQIDAIEKVVEEKFAIVSAPVRSGKTAIIGGIINRIGHFPVVVVTNGRDLVIQTKKALENHTRRAIGLFSEGELEEEDILVTSYQALRSSLSKSTQKKSTKKKKRDNAVKELLNKAKVLVLDECHHSFSNNSNYFLDEFKSLGYKIGMSGTPKPDHMVGLEVEATIGPVVSCVGFEVLINNKRIAKPLVILYDLPYAWFTRHLTNYADVYNSNIVDNEPRNKFIRSIIENLKDKTAYVMVSRVDHGEELRNSIPGSFYVRGSISSETRQQIYESLNSGSLKCVISTVTKEGLNIPNLGAIINAEGMESSLVTIQKMRSLTASENKKVGLVIDFLDKGSYLTGHSRKRQKLYQSLDGFEVKIKRVPVDYFELGGSKWK